MPPNHLWQPGQSGNPKGPPRRPAGYNEAIRNGGTAEELAAILWECARNREAWAIQHILNRVEPQTTQLKITTESDNGFDLSKLNNAELDQLIKLIESAKAPVIDVSADREGGTPAS
jgi:hypothetical protein